MRGRAESTRYAAAVLLIVGAALVAAPRVWGNGLAFFGRSGSAPTIEPGQLRPVVATRLARGEPAVAWVAPTTDGGRCVVLAVGLDASTTAPSPTANSGGWCERPPIPLQSAPIATTINWLNPDRGRFEVALAGELSAASGIARLELDSPAGSAVLPLAEGLFVGSLPPAAAGELPPGGPYVLVGFDEVGSEVARLDLGALLEQAQPPGYGGGRRARAADSASPREELSIST